jgi:8-oxo-dGTP diphosphatase
MILCDSIIHVAVGVIRNNINELLITRRSENAHQGGLWEFPGGKLEPGENVVEALFRELYEEVGIQVESASPLIKIHHDYGDCKVLLDVWSVTQYKGEAQSCEGQKLTWVSENKLDNFSFPKANIAIIKALKLPKYYVILEGRDSQVILENCRRLAQSGIKLIQLRAKSLEIEQANKLLKKILQICADYQVKLLINSDFPAKPCLIDGIHLSSKALMATQTRPKGHTIIAASCHNLIELQHAEAINVDFAVLAPVQKTVSHPLTQALGWQEFARLVKMVNLPVYALGGLKLNDLDTAILAGAQGIAGISAFLPQYQDYRPQIPTHQSTPTDQEF